MNTRIPWFAVFVFALAAPSLAESALRQAPRLRLPAYKKIELNNGMTVFFMEKHQVPLVSFSFVVRAGAVADPADKAGTASLTADLLRKGTRSRTADQVSEELDFLGGRFDAGATPDYTSGSAEFMKKDVSQGTELLADILMNPTFPESEFTKLVRQNLDGIKSSKDRAGAVLSQYFEHYLFGSHPYGRPTDGDEKTLTAITRDDVAGFHRTYYTPGNTILAVAGDFDREGDRSHARSGEAPPGKGHHGGRAPVSQELHQGAIPAQNRDRRPTGRLAGATRILWSRRQGDHKLLRHDRLHGHGGGEAGGQTVLP